MDFRLARNPRSSHNANIKFYWERLLSLMQTINNRETQLTASHAVFVKVWRKIINITLADEQMALRNIIYDDYWRIYVGDNNANRWIINRGEKTYENILNKHRNILKYRKNCKSIDKTLNLF